MLRIGEALPTIRELASRLQVNRNTVAKAYAELENLDVIKSIPGKGCFIKAAKTPFTKEVRHKILVAEIDEALVTAHQLQVGAPAFLALVGERVEFFEREMAKTLSGKDSTEESQRVTEARTPAGPASGLSSPSEAAAGVSAADAGNWSPLTD